MEVAVELGLEVGHPLLRWWACWGVGLVSASGHRAPFVWWDAVNEPTMGMRALALHWLLYHTYVRSGRTDL